MCLVKMKRVTNICLVSSFNQIFAYRFARVGGVISAFLSYLRYVRSARSPGSRVLIKLNCTSFQGIIMGLQIRNN